MDVSVCIPTIPPRAHLLRRAVGSVYRQTMQPTVVHIALDTERLGAPANRTRALAMATTEWVAFLDDDDEFEPQHLQRCLQHAADTGADVVYPWFTVVGGTDPLGWEGRPFDAAALRRGPNYIPITVLVRRELAMATGGFVDSRDKARIGSTTPWATCEDWAFWLALLDLGATFSHLPERTWKWHHHGSNTSGCSDRW